jgi:AcrR family transcriptional regulator
VAKRVGIAAPSIYRHFRDTEHLMMAVVERSFETFAAGRDAAGGAGDPAAALLARCRAYCHFALANPGPYRFMFSNQAPAGDPTQLTAGTAAFGALAASIKTCQQASLATAPEEPLHLAAQVWAALHGLVLLRMNIPAFPWPATLDDMADLAVTRLIGLTPPHAASRRGGPA